jgi:hypothetical protein
MGIEFGRISGPLLAANLQRGGVDLAFENDLLYLDVANGRIGVNTDSVSRTLTVLGTTGTTNLITPTRANLANSDIVTTRIQNTVNSIYLQPDQANDPTIVSIKFATAKLEISNQLIENTITDSDINLSPTGKTVFNTFKVNIDGDLHATGNITWDGDVTIGNSDTDSVDFVAEIASHIIPDADNTYDLGSNPAVFFPNTGLLGENGKEWAHLYSTNLNVTTEIITENISVTNLTVSRDSIFRSNTFIGNSLVDDQVTFNSYLTSNLIPTTTSTYTLGTDLYRWDTVFLKNLNIDSVINIQDNTITTILDSGNPAPIDLKLYASGTGVISVALSDVEITNDLTVGQLTTISNVLITGELQLLGDNTYTLTGQATRIGNTDITGSLTQYGTHYTQFPDIEIYTNGINTYALLGDKDLILIADGTGIVKTSTSDVTIENNLEILVTAYINTVDATTVSANAYDIGSVYVTGNSITTNTLDTNLVLEAVDAGIIQVTTTDVEITNNLVVNQLTTLANVEITGSLDLTGNWIHSDNTIRTGNTDITGNLTVNGANTVQFNDIQFVGNVVRTTLGTDLELTALGTGIVKTMFSDVEITNDLDVGQYGYFNNLTVNADIATGDFTIGDFFITSNDIITTVGSDIDIVLSANGTAKVYAPTNDVVIANDLTVTSNVTVNGGTGLKYVEIGSLLSPATLTQTGNIDQTGSTEITGDLQSPSIVIVPNSWIESGELKIQGTTISVKTIGTDLILKANSSGGIVFDRQIKITSNVIGNIFNVNDIGLSFNNVLITEDGQLLLLEDSSDYYLADVKNDRDLSVIFEPNGTGNVIIDSNKALAIAYGTAVLESNGEIRQNSVTGVYQGFAATGNVSLTGLSDGDYNTYMTAELTPGYNDNIIRFGINGTAAGYIDTSKLYSSTFHIDNVKITNNQITNLVSGNDLEFSASGYIGINGVAVSNSTVTNVVNNVLTINSTGTGYVKFDGTAGIVLPSGTNSNRPATPELGQTRYNTDRSVVETWDGANWAVVSGASNAATEEEIVAETNLWAFVLG